MAEFIFPETGAHCVSINGLNLIFSPAMGIPMLVNEAAYDLVTRCSGMSLSESEDWLSERHGEESAYIADEFRKIIEAGYFSEPQLDFERSEADPPLLTSFGIGITHKCNMRCRYCFAAGARNTDEPKDISPDTARAAVDFLFDVLQPLWVRISLGITGEPLLKWNLVKEVIEYARQRSQDTGIGVGFCITTNGMEINQEILDFLLTRDDTNVILSWDGPREIHSLQRPGPGGADTYDRVRNAFILLRDNVGSKHSVLPTVGSQPGPMVVATVSALNPDIAAVFAHLFDQGARDIAIKPARVTADPDIAVTEQNLRAFKSNYTKFANLLLMQDELQIERLSAIMNEVDFLGRCILSIANNMRAACRCSAARTHLEVDTNGDIYPCPSLAGMAGFQIGNVHTGIEEHGAKSFRETTFLSNLEACKDCWAKYICGGPCTYVSAVTMECSNVPYAPDCELTRHLIELGGYIVARLRVERPGLLEQVLARKSVQFKMADSTEPAETVSPIGEN